MGQLTFKKLKSRSSRLSDFLGTIPEGLDDIIAIKLRYYISEQYSDMVADNFSRIRKPLNVYAGTKPLEHILETCKQVWQEAIPDSQSLAWQSSSNDNWLTYNN